MPARENSMTMQTQKIRVAAVEDQPAMLDRLQRILSKSPDTTWVAGYSSAEQALRALPELEIDVLLVDLQLPGMSGLDLITELNRQESACSIVVLTNYDLDDHVFPAIRNGAKGYLLKSEDTARIVDTIRLAHSDMMLFNASIARRIRDYMESQSAETEIPTDLSPREKQVLKLMADGLAYKQIADNLSLGMETIRTYTKGIFKKLHVQSRTEAVMRVYGKARRS